MLSYSCPLQWRLTIFIFHVGIDLTSLEQQLDYRLVPVLYSPRQQHPTVTILRVSIGLVLEQQLDALVARYEFR